MTIYQIKSLSFTYHGCSSPVLRSISFAVEAGEHLCLVGPSGSGKSTLMNVLGLLEKPTPGQVYFAGCDVATLQAKELDRARRFDVGFVFQDHQLIEVLTVEENVEYFLCRQGLAKRERQERVTMALTAVGLEDRRSARPDELSGGQRQRVSIARALAKRPKVILADEPTASLDRAASSQIMDILRSLRDELGVTVIVASHDPLAMAAASRVLEMVDGRLCDSPTTVARRSHNSTRRIKDAG